MATVLRDQVSFSIPHYASMYTGRGVKVQELWRIAIDIPGVLLGRPSRTRSLPSSPR